FSESLYIELKPAGVRVCCVCPGTTRTEFFDRGGFESRRDVLYRVASATADDVARKAIKAMAKGKMTMIHGFLTRLQAGMMVRLMPGRMVAEVVGYALRKLRG